ncbi:hypothetical protein L21TH_2677 [Caldisalinibacter kiritimatiensis]|uniref:Phosphodiester glycosidase domain-containing protein n=1 Tax=Caldisalinibacter kiritimatiensis TaxID=1304284 RepID=R1CRF7_9FIRM|nr:hypothetical protein L21TH_2677 [Caldisalinibacter kiritimatiensis]
MVTVDGRHASFKGVDQEKLAKIMIELGAYEAMNLDGGGSTTMALAPLDKENIVIVNRPSDGSERAIINGIGVFNNAPKSSLKYIEISTSDTNIFVNASRKFYIKGYDKYYNPVEIDLDRARFSVEGIKGKFKDNILYTEECGIGTVKVRYKGKTDEIKINVINQPKDLVIKPEKFHIDFESKKQFEAVYGINDDGFKAKINPNDIEWKVVGNIGKIEDGVFYSNDNATSGAIIASMGNAIENTLVSVGHSTELIEGFESIKNLEFTSYPAEVSGSIERENKDKKGKYSLKLEYDFTQTDSTRAAYINFSSDGIKLNKKPDKLGMWVYGNESNHWLRGELVDNEGRLYRINFCNNVDWKGWKWVTANIPSDVKLPITLKKVYVVETNSLNKDMGYLLFDHLQTIYNTPIKNIDLPEETIITDRLQRHSEVKKNGYSFTITSGINELNNLLKYHISKRISNIISESDLGIVMNGMNFRFSTTIEKPLIEVKSGFTSFTHKDTLFIQLDNANNGIRATEPNQWLDLMNRLNNSTEKNIILLLPKPVFGKNGFTDKLEAELLHEILTDYKIKGKNIFVLYGGNKNKVDIKSGIRYIEFNNQQMNNNFDLFELNYIKFIVNEDEITYEFLPMFK